MAKKKLQEATDQRKFVMVYNDFIDSNLLTDREKMLFITLKKYANDRGKCLKYDIKLNKLIKNKIRIKSNRRTGLRHHLYKA